MQTRNMKTRFLSCAVSVLMMPTLLPAVGLQVYAEPEDFDFVLDHISKRIPADAAEK